MPRATMSNQEERFDLKSLDEGFVVLRRMSYGQVLERRSLLKLSVSSKKGQKSLEGEMALANEKIQIFEFRFCIVDHNLEDEHGRKLNLTDPVVLRSLDPRVGTEIEGLISDMNNFEEDEKGE